MTRHRDDVAVPILRAGWYRQNNKFIPSGYVCGFDPRLSVGIRVHLR
jgi:hypothetical protein